MLHEVLVMPVFLYRSESVIWKGKDRSWIKDVKMGNLRGLFARY